MVLYGCGAVSGGVAPSLSNHVTLYIMIAPEGQQQKKKGSRSASHSITKEVAVVVVVVVVVVTVVVPGYKRRNEMMSERETESRVL